MRARSNAVHLALFFINTVVHEKTISGEARFAGSVSESGSQSRFGIVLQHSSKTDRDPDSDPNSDDRNDSRKVIKWTVLRLARNIRSPNKRAIGIGDFPGRMA